MRQWFTCDQKKIGKREHLSSLMFRALIAILDIETGVLICNIMSNDLHETVSGGVTGTHPCSWVTALNSRVPTSVLCLWQHLCFVILCKSPDQERAASVLPATKSMTVKWPAYSREDGFDLDSSSLYLWGYCLKENICILARNPKVALTRKEGQFLLCFGKKGRAKVPGSMRSIKTMNPL